jgi:hypothetical protein
MSDDIPVFRSDAPPLTANPGLDGDGAAKPHPAGHGGGALRQIVDSKVFAPLDEARELSNIEILPDSPGRPRPEAPTDEAARTRAEATPDEGPTAPVPLPAPEPEPPQVRARRIRKLSPELIARALAIREETVSISATVDQVIAALPDFDPTASDPQDEPALELDQPVRKASAKE